MHIVSINSIPEQDAQIINIDSKRSANEMWLEIFAHGQAIPISVIIPNALYIGQENQLQLEITCIVQPKILETQVKWYFNDTQLDINNATYKVCTLNFKHKLKQFLQ